MSVQKSRALMLKPLDEFHNAFLMLQQHRHHHGLKRPRTCDHHTGLNMHLRAIKKPIEDWLISFGKCPLKWSPATAFLFDEGAERRERLAYGIIL
jgi:hypothetical protein